MISLLCDFLDIMGVDAVACPPGPLAPTCIAQAHPDLVILDVRMPEVSGVEVFHRLRAEPSTRTTPVIFFTANTEMLLKQLPEYAGLGARLVPKPDVHELSLVVLDAFSR